MDLLLVAMMELMEVQKLLLRGVGKQVVQQLQTMMEVERHKYLSMTQQDFQ